MNKCLVKRRLENASCVFIRSRDKNVYFDGLIFNHFESIKTVVKRVKKDEWLTDHQNFDLNNNSDFIWKSKIVHEIAFKFIQINHLLINFEQNLNLGWFNLIIFYEIVIWESDQVMLRSCEDHMKIMRKSLKNVTRKIQ
jgi:hypothetical protein